MSLIHKVKSVKKFLEWKLLQVMQLIKLVIKRRCSYQVDIIMVIEQCWIILLYITITVKCAKFDCKRSRQKSVNKKKEILELTQTILKSIIQIQEVKSVKTHSSDFRGNLKWRLYFDYDWQTSFLFFATKVLNMLLHCVWL